MNDLAMLIFCNKTTRKLHCRTFTLTESLQELPSRSMKVDTMSWSHWPDVVVTTRIDEDNTKKYLTNVLCSFLQYLVHAYQSLACIKISY